MWRLLVVFVVACGRGNFELADARADAHADGVSGPTLVFDFEFESDGTLHDRAQGPDGQCTACPTLMIDPTRGSVLQLDGTKCFFVDGASVHLQQFTIALWFNRTTMTGGEVFGLPMNGATGNLDTYELYSEINDMVFNMNDMMQVLVKATADQWHHIAATYDGTRITEFLDGLSIGALDVGPVTYTNDNLYFGCDLNVGALSAFSTGALDSVRFYDGVLAQDAITALATP